VLIFFKKTFGKRKIVSDLSANAVQTLITQLFGVFIFYFTSRYLPKDDFGEFNWSSAVTVTILVISSFGLDLVLVKRIAAGSHGELSSGMHLLHSSVSGLFWCLVAGLVHSFFPAFREQHPFFLIVFISSAINNISNSLKLTLNGYEKYKYIAITVLVSNVLKFGAVLGLFLTDYFTVPVIVSSYIAVGCVEIALGYYFTSHVKGNARPFLYNAREYRLFIRESLPQLGVVLFDSALARVDWILLGVLSTATITAEYSFAYRVFELSKLPLHIIAPVLLARFSKLFKESNMLSDSRVKELQLFFKLEMFASMLIPVALVCMWSPLVDFITSGKYGKSNELTYMLLAGCTPLHFIVNFLWTMAFVRGKLKTLMYITIVTCLVNIGLNLAFIPFLGGQGAALAFLASTVVQMLLYLAFTQHPQVKPDAKTWILAFVNAIIAIGSAKLLFSHFILAGLWGIVCYCIFAVLTRQINLKELRPGAQISS